MAIYESLRVPRGGQKADVLRLKSLAYDGQTGNFTAGLKVTGGTSGATGYIVSDTDGGTTGTLVLKDVRGTFADNEALTDTSTGAAVVNGTLGLASLTPADQMVLAMDTELFSRSDALAALRAMEQKIIEMPWPKG